MEILTIRQWTAWELRKQGLKYKEIGCQTEIIVSAAFELVHKAESRLRDFVRYQKKSIHSKIDTAHFRGVHFSRLIRWGRKQIPLSQNTRFCDIGH